MYGKPIPIRLHSETIKRAKKIGQKVFKEKNPKLAQVLRYLIQRGIESES